MFGQYVMIQFESADRSMLTFCEVEVHRVKISGEYVIWLIDQSGFSQMNKTGNIAIIANFLSLYNCSFLLYLHEMMFVNVK